MSKCTVFVASHITLKMWEEMQDRLYIATKVNGKKISQAQLVRDSLQFYLDSKKEEHQ